MTLLTRKSELAILGGEPVRTRHFPSYNVITANEIQAVTSVMKTGVLSRFLGTWHDDFYGGPQVQAFEREWSDAFNAKHSVTLNSATSALYAAIGAAGIGLGDEVIVSPYTMSASATAPLVYNATPVFADIDPATYCLSAETIEPKITERTKAILLVHIFGGVADLDPILKLAKKHNLIVIEDCAQAPMAKYKGQYVGTIGDMGIFSLNYHKHIHTGEGGILTTNNDDLAEKVKLIRNHAEAVVDGKGVTDLTNMIGFNYRLGEIECAIGRSLLKRLPDLLQQRQNNVQYLEKNLGQLDHLSLPFSDRENTHSFYLHALEYDEKESGVSRSRIIDAIRAELAPCAMREHEGVLVNGGYVKPLYLQSLYQKRAHPALDGTFSNPLHSHEKGSCPNVEHCHYNSIITHELMRPGLSETDLQDVSNAFEKVMTQLNKLQ